MISIKTKYQLLKVLAVFLAVNLFTQAVFPVVSYALTSGPSQPEIQSFEPVGTTEMVDLFSGDFTYNIPLFEVPGPNGGYPFNLFYNSGISMDQEASWTGLGWNLNPGAIVRNMRGFPDEYNNAPVKRETDMRPNVTIGVGGGGNLEFFGGDLGLGVSLGISVYYNNYKGVGYSLEPGFSMSPGNMGGMAAGVGFNFSLDSQEGIGANASLSLKDSDFDNQYSYNVGVGYNSREGLSKVSLSVDISSKQRLGSIKTVKANQERGMRASIGGSSSLSFFSGGYSPQVSQPMQGRNLALQFKQGFSGYAVYGSGYVSGFFSTQYLKDRGVEKTSPAYGYLNLQNATQDNSLMDFNREKDGMIRKNSPNLAIPTTTPDVYSVNGHGVAGMFRAFRSDAGRLSDPEVKSLTVGGSFGVDVGPGFGPHIGVNATVNYSTSESGKWNDQNNTQFNFSSSSSNSLYEPVYFKTYGEHTSDPLGDLAYMGDEDPVRVQLTKSGSVANKKFIADAGLVKEKGNTLTSFTYDPNAIDDQREPRNVNVHYIDHNQGNGMVAVNPDGTRYVYGKKAMNNQHIECQFSLGTLADICDPVTNIVTDNGKAKYDHKNTNQYYNRTQLPPYAYSYLLTEILGADYIDITGNGLTDDDFGYWVKFNYNEFNTNDPVIYNWRTPFTGANVLKGLNTTFEDNQGTYMFGEKEVYYVTSVETKTHKAIFNVTDRKDGRGAAIERQNDNEVNKLASMKKLDNVQLFAKDNLSTPIKTVHFKYSYTLCQGIENNDGSVDDNGTDAPIANAGGKLTLESIWFTYQNNNRGSLSPYVFNYNQNNVDENPVYNTHHYDRWGNYKPVTDFCKGVDLPYVEQFNQANPDDPAFRTQADIKKSVWNLKEITLPSGGIIKVDYESDDYGYVQDKRAMQMFEIAGLQGGNPPGDFDYIFHERWASGDKRRVYFKLEKSTSDPNEILKYVEGIDKVYFKVFMHVRQDIDDRTDYVSGYSDIEGQGMDNATMVNGKYTRGWIQLGRPRIGTKNGARNLAYHPFSVAAWQYIRTSQPQLAGMGKFDVDPNTNKKAARDKVKSLFSIFSTIKQTFQGFYNHAYKNDWGEKVILSKSSIRLNSPDKKKIGGGVRVKQISLSDSWDETTNNAEKESVYGQVYDYTMEEDGQTISSGVATYEPAIGGDENPFRNAKEYPEVIPLKTNNNLYFELPINESYYPGASVGYRKVTVKSLATHYEKIDTDENTVGNQNAYDIPAGIMTTGATVHEFFTAKEFPVITDATPIEIQPFDLFVPIPLIGQITVNDLTASQGYSVTLNDMHGKLRKVSNYKQDKNGTILFESPISYVEHFYDSKLIKRDDNPVNDYFVLNNEVNVLQKNSGGGFTKVSKIVGQDHEFFTDMRKMRVHGLSGGVKINNDWIYMGIFFFPALVPWPSIGSATTEVRTVVTNKVIHKFGILKATEAFRDGSKVRTENLVFDDMTGEPVLVKVNNNFNDPIYSYTVPAYKVYDGMGAAYHNIGLTFSGTLSNYSAVNKTYEVTMPAGLAGVLVPGDEFLMGSYRVSYVRRLNDNIIIAVSGNPAGLSGSYDFILTRSGRRNVLTAKAGNITTLGDKTNSVIGNPLPDQAP